MDIKFIRSKIKVCSDKVDKANNECTFAKNEALQDFVIWLCGYMDGMEHHEHSAVKIMVDTLNKDKKTPLV